MPFRNGTSAEGCSKDQRLRLLTWLVCRKSPRRQASNLLIRLPRNEKLEPAKIT